MALDEIIKHNRGGRPARRTAGNKEGGDAGVARGGRQGGRPAGGRQSTRRGGTEAPYARPSNEDDGTMSGASISDLAATGTASLKVSSTSKPNTVAGAICNVVRESPGGLPPSILATGPAALNQAIKAIAIARKYLLEEDPPIDIVAKPTFEQANAPPPCRRRALATSARLQHPPQPQLAGG